MMADSLDVGCFFAIWREGVLYWRASMRTRGGSDGSVAERGSGCCGGLGTIAARWTPSCGQEVAWPGARGPSSDIAYTDPRGNLLIPRCTGASHRGLYRPRAVRSAP